MSLTQMAAAWNQDVQPAARKLVLMAMADQARDCGCLWPAVATIAKRACLKPRMVQYHLKALAEGGLIVIDATEKGPDGRDLTNRYRLQFAAPSSCNELHRGDAVDCTGGVQSVAPLRAQAPLPTTPEPSLEPSYEPLPAAQAVSVNGKHPKPDPDAYSPDFMRFWDRYPRRIAKRAAWKAWQARIKAGTAPDDMAHAATHYSAYCTAQGTAVQFIKHPATFIGPDLHFEDFVAGIPQGEAALPKPHDETTHDPWSIECRCTFCKEKNAQ